MHIQTLPNSQRGHDQLHLIMLSGHRHQSKCHPTTIHVWCLQFATSVELAALAPCSLIFGSLYVFNALSVATIG